MSVGRNLVIFGVWAAGMATWAWWKYVKVDERLHLPPAEPVASRPKSAPERPATWVWNNESAWIVNGITQEIAEWCLLSTGGSSKGTTDLLKSLRVEVTPASANHSSWLVTATVQGRQRVSMALPLKEHVWSPAMYAGWAQALRTSWKTTNAAENGAPSIPDLPTRLLEPNTATLVSTSRELGQALARHPGTTRLHEQAALLLGTFALREAAGSFTDVRPSLARMTAHLALGLVTTRDQNTPERTLSQAILLSLLDLQNEALAEIQRLPPGLEAWHRSLTLRNTNDWRIMEAIPTLTVLEEIELGRALLNARDVRAFVEHWQSSACKDLPDWRRIGTTGDLGLGAGDLLTSRWMEVETNGLAETWKQLGNQDVPAGQWVPLLNAPPVPTGSTSGRGRPFREILGWDAWAGFHQRHLCHAMERTRHFLLEKWGVANATARFEEETLRQFAGLRLLPFVTLRTATDARQYEESLSQCARLCWEAPEAVTTRNWWSLRQRLRFPPPTVFPEAPRPAAWFHPELPPGTLLEVAQRLDTLDPLAARPRAYWKQQASKAPFNHKILHLLAQKEAGGSPGLDTLRHTYAPILGYHLGAMREVGEQLRDQPHDYLEHMTRVCQLAPDESIWLGEYLVERGLVEQAAFVFRAAHQRAVDRVLWSNHNAWLVNHLYETGQTDEAVAIAREGAGLATARGLETMARLMERLTRWEEALEHFQALATRHGERGLLLLFLHRQSHASPAVAAALGEEVSATFPGGMKEVVLGEFDEAPQAGVIIGSSNPLTEHHDMRAGEIIVALDGTLVENLEQYELIRSRNLEAALQLIIWTGTEYRELEVTAPARQLGVELNTYLP